MKKFLLFFALLSISGNAIAQNAVEAMPSESRILKQLPPDMIKEPLYLKGNLASWVNDSNEFIIYVETSVRKFLFVLQMETARNVKGKFVSLTFLDDAMVLSDGKANYYFGIIPVAENKALMQAHMIEQDFLAIVQGYGLAVHKVPASDANFSLDKLRGAKSVYDYLDARKL